MAEYEVRLCQHRPRVCTIKEKHRNPDTHCIKIAVLILEHRNTIDAAIFKSGVTLGNLNTKCPLHVVVGSNHEQLWIITAYYPSSDKWESDLKTRKEN